MKMRLVALGLGVLMAGSSAWAHHAFAAEFDATKPLQLRGKVMKMDWINPTHYKRAPLSDRLGLAKTNGERSTP
jgi:Family of unknown function (DUF6152)